MQSSYTQYASVILSSGLKKELDYGILKELQPLISEGSLVQVPLRGVLQTGIVVRIHNECNLKRVLPVKKVISKDSLMTDKLFELAIWMSKYYQAPLAKTIKLFFPKSVQKDMGHKQQLVITRSKTLQEIQQFCLQMRSKKPKQVELLDYMLKVDGEILLTELLEQSSASRSTLNSVVEQGLLSASKTIIERNPLKHAEFFPSNPKVLNGEQQEALKKIEKTLDAQEFHVHLLHGVTGSGKTELYLQAIQNTLNKGRTALMLVPEVALTTQTIEKFKSRFKEKIAILHHRLSSGERYDEWHSIRNGKARIVIGARSAVFAPLSQLGLVIVDEEHEYSYKQTEEMPAYHARDLAVMRGKIEGACVILGSATPSFESYQNTQNGKYSRLILAKRVEEKPLPNVTVVDMKHEFEKAGGYTAFSDLLLSGIKKRFLKGEQVILFLNRRGYHTSLLCGGCGEVVKCPHCEIALTFHLKTDRLICHLCDYQLIPPRTCPKCKEQTFKFKGSGTEKIERQLQKIFPSMRTLRMDADTTKHVGSYEKLYRGFKNHKADILIGTQMIAKGLHFPNVTLVGILNCDAQLNLPDFRASEIAFQLITQVAGRAGRGEVEGEVILQTFNPDNPILKLAVKQDFDKFYQYEIRSRELFNYPPFTRLAKIVFKGKSEEGTLKYANQFDALLRKLSGGPIEVQSPFPCGYPKIKEFYRFQILIKCRNMFALGPYLKEIEKRVGLPRNIRVMIDIDPSSTFF
ncbi:MAG: Primosomal protein N' [Chlamydiae bacterium]|nr:Primosomal protein N' [Chlamydiota bacterium]